MYIYFINTSASINAYKFETVYKRLKAKFEGAKERC